MPFWLRFAPVDGKRLMLRCVSPGPSVIVCSTCRSARDEPGARGGASLEAAMLAMQDAEPSLRGVAVYAMPCLFACDRSCTVHIRAPGKVGYVLGDFAPNEDAACAILQYAVHHAASAEGEVAYCDWPEGVKGHFITRTPPEGYVCT